MELGFFKDVLDTQVYTLAIVLYIVGLGLRKMKLNNKFIPIILGVIGIVFVTLYVFSINSLSTFQEVCGAITTAFMQGVLCAALAVYGDQMFKQLFKSNYTEEEKSEVKPEPVEVPEDIDDKVDERIDESDNEEDTEE